MNIRNRRLRKDYEKVLAELGSSKHVRVEAIAGDPPHQYRVTYRVNGIIWDDQKADVTRVGEHVVDIHLPLGYPKQAPRATMRTPAWHPNIGDYVCIGDYWSAGVTLVDIIAHIGDMIQYRSFNLRSPVNKAAATWAQRNTKSFPVGTRHILPPGDETAAVEVAPRPDDVEISLGPVRYKQ
jgi:ubiquitin-protein ligase